ncbi:MAG: hypothetical protein IJ484_06900 [Oscillospiraceae bacterium]|nr:hypothetical protein [Oscillospiraceae bacterium]
MKSYDIVMPILKRDWPAAQVNLPFVFKNLPVKRLVVLSGPDIQELLPDDERIVFVNENELVERLSLAAVKKIMNERIYTDKRAGWYFQQFLKMAYARVCTDEQYVVWDADMVPVQSICFEQEDGRLLFSLKEEYNPPYFETMKTLLGLEKCIPESFIAENMIFDTALMCAMLDEIEANDAVQGGAFWEKCLYAVKQEDLKGSSFSEFETFGTWVMTHHPERYATRRLKALRSGKNILGKTPSAEVLEWAGESYDTVSMEKFNASTPLRHLAASEKYRATHTAAELDELKGRFKVIPAVYRWGKGLWPRFKIWGGKYKRKLRALRQKKG